MHALKATRQLGLFVSVVGLCLVTGLVFFDNATRVANSQLALSMNADRGAAFTAVMVAASRYGREYFWICIVGLMLAFGKRETKLMTLELVLLFGVGIVVGETMKYVLYEPRPFVTMTDIVTRVPKDYDSSFPSGHALIVAIGATFALLKFRNKRVALLLALEAAIVTCSRVYVGMHYPLDVLAGIFLGSTIVLLGLRLEQAAKSIYRKDHSVLSARTDSSKTSQDYGAALICMYRLAQTRSTTLVVTTVASGSFD